MNNVIPFPGRRKGAPKPANFEALAAAWDDPYKFSVECAKYREQLDGPAVRRGVA